MNFRSLRFKLTLYYSMVLALTLGASGYIAYDRISNQFQRNFDLQLEAKAELLKKSIRFEGERPVFEVDASRESQYAFSGIARYLMITDQRGAVLYQADELLWLEPTFKPESMRAVASQKTRFATFPTELKETVRFLQIPFLDPHGHTYLIHVGAPFTHVEEHKRQLLWGLSGLLAVLFGLSLAGGWLLSKRSLQPVEEMTRLAQRLGSNDLSARIAVPSTRDELSALAETFNAMISRLKAQFEHVKQFSADVSHELRTPLTIMQGENEVALRSRLTEEEYRTVLISNLEELARLNRIISDLLVLARADAGEVDLQISRLDLSEIARDLCEQFRPLAEQSGKILKCNAALSAPLMGDAVQMRRLMVNLVDNALKYTPTGGTIEVGASSDSSSTQLYVKDTGVGIPENEQELIFDRFYRGSRSDKRLHGSGLGLSIARQIVHAHGGKISVDSRPGGGTTFHVSIPTGKSGVGCGASTSVESA